MSELLLIVDDNPVNIQLLGATLKREGYLLEVARNGVQAVEVVAQSPPDLILLDVVMPEMDGHEACRRLKEDPDTRDIPVIFLTARTEPEDVVRGFELGAADYVAKPFNTAELLARVRTHLALRAAQRQLVEAERLKTLVEAAGGAAHEINQPLQAITTRLELAAMDVDPDSPQAEAIRYALAQVGRIVEIIGRMKAVHRYATRPYPGGRKIVDYGAASREGDGE